MSHIKIYSLTGVGSARFAHLVLCVGLTSASAMTLSLPRANAGTSKILDLRGDFRFLSDAPLEKIQGTAEGARGRLVVDLANLAKSSGTVSVRVAKMSTGSPIRDEHLRGEQWLDSEKHPKLTFAARDLSEIRTEQQGEVFVATGTVRGDFTLRGITKPLTSTFTLKMKGARAKLELSFAVALADYEIKGRDGIIGKKVGQRIVITGRLVGRARDEGAR